jgi:hypothetical protein
MNHRIVRRLSLGLIFLAVVLLVPTVIVAQGTPPFIPHPLEGRDACLVCHETGVAGAPQIPEDHAGRTNEMCRACHQPAMATEELSLTASREPVSVTESPTRQATPTRSATPPAIPHPLEGRDACLACHETGVAGAPQISEDHEGRTNNMCRACHQPAMATEELSLTASREPVSVTESPTRQATPTRSATPPAIPHPLEGRDACLACHETGVAGAPQVPEDHEGRTNNMCRACHQPAMATEELSLTPSREPVSVTESPTLQATPTRSATPEVTPTETPTPEATPTPAGPLPVPHTLEGRENCLECHVSTQATAVPEGGPPAIPHPLIGREHCLACHEEGVGGAPQIPEDHAGRTEDICQACHQPSQIPAPATPTPPAVPVPTPIVYPQVEGVNTCLDCHSQLGGKDKDITDQWQRSIHAERDVTCADCHGGDPSATTVDEAMSPDAGYIGAPAKSDVPALCASCHADVSLMRQYDLPTDQYAQYKESVHGIRLAEGDTNVATCFDCHGGHQILKANDPASSVYPVNVPTMCASCHADQALMAPYDIPTNQFALYQQSVHGIALLEKQDFRAPTCATCHGTHGAAPPGFQEVANVCGDCHGATQEYYLKSPHAKAGEEAPKCVTCHGRYDVGEPSEALYLGSEPRHCGVCHTPDSPGGQVAQSLYDSITTATQAQQNAETAVQEAQGLGMLVAPLEARLREANTSLISARAAQHTLDISTVRQRTEDAQTIADEVKTSADTAVAESVFRRQAMVVAVAVIALIIVALYLLKRELDRRLEDES